MSELRKKHFDRKLLNRYSKLLRNDPYEVLGVTKEATRSEITKAYKKLALKYHPDKNVNNQEPSEKFLLIGESYGILNDEKLRKIYDKLGFEGLEVSKKFGKNVVCKMLIFNSNIARVFFLLFGALTCCYCFCCCFKCCCNFCCGRYDPQKYEKNFPNPQSQDDDHLICSIIERQNKDIDIIQKNNNESQLDKTVVENQEINLTLNFQEKNDKITSTIDEEDVESQNNNEDGLCNVDVDLKNQKNITFCDGNISLV